MGGEPWMYFVPYDKDLGRALGKLRARELRAGRYHPVMRRVPFPVLDDSPAPGGRHETVEAAREAGAETGTRSILDIDRVVARPRQPRLGQEEISEVMSRATRGEVVDMSVMMGAMPDPDDFGTVAPLAPEALRRLYGTDKPTKAAVLAGTAFLDDIERGMGIYIILYEGDFPREICFAGYSYD